MTDTQQLTVQIAELTDRVCELIGAQENREVDVNVERSASSSYAPQRPAPQRAAPQRAAPQRADETVIQELTRPRTYDGSNQAGVLLTDNPDRVRYVVFNAGSAPLYLLCDDSKDASPERFKVKVAPGGFYEQPTGSEPGRLYTGEVRYAWGQGAVQGDRAQVTEVFEQRRR